MAILAIDPALAFQLGGPVAAQQLVAAPWGIVFHANPLSLVVMRAIRSSTIWFGHVTAQIGLDTARMHCIGRVGDALRAIAGFQPHAEQDVRGLGLAVS